VEKKMKKMVMSVVVLAMAMSAAPARAWGIKAPAAPSVPSGGGGGATPQAIDAFLGSAVVAEKLVADSSQALFAAVASKEEIAEIQARLEAAQKIQDTKERDAAVKKIEEDQRAVAAKHLEASDAEAKVAALDDAKKAQVKVGIWNASLGLLKNVDLVAQGKALVSGVPNPAVATKLGEVKTALTSIGGQMDGLKRVAVASKKLMSAVGLEALPTSASEAPKAANIG
jgi:hypothetical protein